MTCTTDSPDVASVKGGKVCVMDCVIFRNAFFENFLKSVTLFAVKSLHRHVIYVYKSNVSALNQFIILFHKCVPRRKLTNSGIFLIM